MKIQKSTDPKAKPAIVMMVYGEGGVGKTTFAAKSPEAVIADCENGTKYLGLRGIEVDIGHIREWSNMKEFLNVARKDEYKTVVVDPIGELMEKLKFYMQSLSNNKLTQKDGSPTMAGWGWLKATLKMYVKALRDTGKNVIIVAHLEEHQDENRIVKRPKIQTKLSDDLVNLVDIVGYMTTVQKEGEESRVIIVDPGSDKYVAKDRTGRLGKVIPPEFEQIMDACQGTKEYSWSQKKKKKKSKKKKSKKKKSKKKKSKKKKSKKKKKKKSKKSKEKTEIEKKLEKAKKKKNE